MDEDRQPVERGAGDDLSRTTDAVAGAGHPPLPPRLRRRLEATAAAWNRGELRADHPSQSPPGAGQGAPASPARAAASTQPVAARAGWYAAAACCALAVAGWWPRLQPHLSIVSAVPGIHTESASHWILRREAGMQAETHGEVVWDNVRQQGYVTIDGLPAVDGRREQYQLWVFDAARDDRYPIAAGVFDVAEHGQPLTIPIKPALRVQRPVAFAITVERTGGVVVSDRSQLVALARTDQR